MVLADMNVILHCRSLHFAAAPLISIVADLSMSTAKVFALVASRLVSIASSKIARAATTVHTPANKMTRAYDSSFRRNGKHASGLSAIRAARINPINGKC